MNTAFVNFDVILLSSETTMWICRLLIHSLWVAAVMGSLAWFVERTIANSNIHWKYWTFVTALFAVIVLTPIAADFVQPQTAATSPVVWSESGGSLSIESSGFRGESPLPGPAESVEKGDSVSTEKPTVSHPDSRREEATSVDWSEFATWVVLIYILGVWVMLARLVVALGSTVRLRKNAKPLVDGPVAACVGKVAREWGIRSARVAEVGALAAPMVVGLLRPTILVPAAIITSLSTAELEMVMRHELGHIRRRDVWVQLFQRLTEAILFFNPFIWLISRRISRLREYCCDEIVCSSSSEMGEGANPVASRYAQALLVIAESSLAAKKTRLAGVAASGRSPSELRRRIQRILGESTESSGMPSLAIAVVALFLIGILWLPAWAESETLASIKKLGIPISTIASESGNEHLKELAESTGGKYYRVQDRKSLSRIVERENKGNRQIVIDSRLLDEEAKEPSTEVAANPVAPASFPESAIVQVWHLKAVDRTQPKKNPIAGAGGRRQIQPVDVLANVKSWASENSIERALMKNFNAETKHLRWFIPDRAYELEYFRVKSTDSFVGHMKAWGDEVADEPGFSDDVIESVRTDPAGPKVDLLELFKGFGDRVMFTNNRQTGAIESLAWELADQKKVRKGIAQLFRGDPEVLQVNSRSDVAWITLGTTGESSAIALHDKWLLISFNAKLARRLMRLAGPRARDAAMSRAMLRDLKRLVESNRKRMQDLRKSRAAGKASSRELFAAEASFWDSQAQLFLETQESQKAIESFQKAVDFQQLLVRIKREQYEEGTASFVELNRAINEEFIVRKKLEEARERVAGKEAAGADD